MNAAQNGNIFGLPNNNSINNQNTNFNQNFMNQNMMMGNQNMMMGNQNCLNNQNNNMGFNNMANMNGINMNNTNINSNIINEANEKKEFNIHDKEEIFPRNKELIYTDIKPTGDIINLLFILSTGLKIQIYGNKNSTFKEIAKKLCQKINLDERYLKRMKFLFNAEMINIDSDTTLKDLFFNSSHITVYDDDNVIGT